MTATITLTPATAAFDADERIEVLGRTHFNGIGGAGMSVLAEMLHERGVAVDGSDRERSAKTDRLESLGITVQFGQKAEPSCIPAPSSQAIPKSSQRPSVVPASCIAAIFSHC